MLPHGHHLGDNGFLGPLDTEDLCELLQVLSSSFSDREDGIAQPSHAKITQLLIEELDAQLAGEKGDVFDDGKTHAPLLVLSQLDNCWKKRLREKFDANDWRMVRQILMGRTIQQHAFVDLLKLGNNVQADVGKVILEHLKEHGEKVGNGSRRS